MTAKPSTDHEKADRPNGNDGTKRPLGNAVAALVRDAREVRASATALAADASGTEQRYVDEVATALASMELDLSIARAALDARTADSADELHESMAEASGAAHAWLDELRIQSRLARMDARDRADVVSRGLDRAGSGIRHAVSRVGDTLEDDVDRMRKVVLSGIGEVRQALSEAATALRDLGD